MTRYNRWLKLLLRLAGVVSSTAIVAVVMPGSWMAACHQWLGFGEYPQAPITDYLARSLSAFYVFFGGLCILVSADLRRHAATITYLAVTHIVFAGLLLVIDLCAPLPWYWTAPEVAEAAGFGLAVLWLQSKARHVEAAHERR